MNTHDLDEAERLAVSLSAGMLVGMVLPMVEAGVPAGTALRLSSAMLLVESFGEDVLRELGISRATFYRWRAALKGFDLPEEPGPRVVEVVERLALARTAAASAEAS